MKAPAPLLSLTNVSVSFGAVRALHDVSFELGEGDLLCVVGESGSGKSVTSLAIMGLLAGSASIAGSIRFRGEELLGASARRMRELRGGSIAMIFQDPMTALTPVYTIGWQIAEQIQAHQKLGRKAAWDAAVELLAAMEMPVPRVQAGRYPHQLSGGMRQRAMIAMALSCNPALLIADEPTTALDVTVQAQILALLDRLRHETKTAVILVTHDMGIVSDIADNVVVMYSGKVVESAAREDLFSDPRHPYTQGLLRSIPAIHGPRPHRLSAIPGLPPSPQNRPEGCPFRPRCSSAFQSCWSDPPLFSRDGHDVSCHLAATG